MKLVNFSILVAVLFCSCQKDLVEKPKAIAAETFYNNHQEIEAGLNAIYGPLKNSNCLGGLYQSMNEAAGDYVYGRGSYSPFNEYVLDNTNISRVGTVWSYLYQAIKEANICISRIPLTKEVSESDKEGYLGEARFLRGLIYFTMIRNWGGVILKTEENIDSLNLGRSSIGETWNIVLSDLQFAEKNLPEEPRLLGTPYRLAASTVLSEVYLCLNQWEEAKEEANKVIKSNKFSLVEVNTPSDFDNIFGPEVVTSSEEIFYLKFSRQGGNFGFWFGMFAHFPGDGYDGAGGFYGLYSDTILNNVIKSWDDKDLRKKYNWYSYDIGLGANTILNAKFSDPLAVNEHNMGNDYPWYKYSDLLLFFAEADCRANQGPTSEGMEALNQIFRRAYGYAPSLSSPVDLQLGDFDEKSFLDLVIQQRGYETCFEAKRWLDLKRMGVAKEVIKNIKDVDVEDKFLLWPIPVNEMSFNTALDPIKDQNIGY